MSIEYAIGTYVHFLDHEGVSTGNAFQNFHATGNRTFNEVTYLPAGFGFSGTTSSLENASITAGLEFEINELVKAVMEQAANLMWLVEVHTVWLDPVSLDEMTAYSEEVYSVQGYSSNLQRLTVNLGSPLNAVTADIPRRVLSRCLVGALPSTGSLVLS